MSKDVLFTFQSCADLNAIWDSIALPRDPWGSGESDNVPKADKFARKFEQVCALLPNHPEIGLDRDDLHAGVRSLLFQRYVIFYRSRGNCVEILRVLGAAGDANPSAVA